MGNPEFSPSFEEIKSPEEQGKMVDFDRLIQELGFNESDDMRSLVERVRSGEPYTPELIEAYTTMGQAIADQKKREKEIGTLVMLGESLSETRLKYLAGYRQEALEDLYMLWETNVLQTELGQLILELEAEIGSGSQ